MGTPYEDWSEHREYVSDASMVDARRFLNWLIRLRKRTTVVPG
jgi:hypothetical protein